MIGWCIKMGLKEVMLETNDILSNNLDKCVNDNELQFSSSKLYLDIIEDFMDIIKELECSKMMGEVTYDLLTSMYFVSFGLYRNAYISLRSALELGISCIYFIDRNYNYLLWKRNLYDIKWCDLTSDENGVISKKYLNIFFENDYQEFIEIVKSSYRECSEYVHGKYSYMQTSQNLCITYDKEKFNEWNSMFNQVTQILIILLTIRFKDKIEQIEEDNLITLEEVLNRYGLREVIKKNER